MNENNKSRIDAAFKKHHEDAELAYKNIYENIRLQMRNYNGYGLSGEIANIEAKELNQEILKLSENVKQVSITEMLACGIKPYLTQTGWTEIQQKTGFPLVELCKIQVDVMSPSMDENNKFNVDNSKIYETVRRYGIAERVLELTAAIGSSLVIISLFIPGWDLPVKVLCVAGAIIAVISGSGICFCANKKKETVSKFNEITNQQNKEEMQDTIQIDTLVQQITNSQYERNLSLYEEWLEQVKQALIIECDKLSMV